MRNNWEQHDGVLLQTIPYLETSRILKIFTRNAGLLTAMARGKNLEIPFGRAEWTISKTRGDFYSLKEFALLDPFLELRSSYETISGAGAIAKNLLETQAPYKSSPDLYELLLACFSHLKKNPQAITQSFRLKLLRHEGILPQELQQFTVEERSLVSTLATARRFSDLEPLQISLEFAKKLEQFAKILFLT